MQTNKDLRVVKSITATFEKCGHALTDDQVVLLAGALAVWLEQAFKEGYNDGYRDGGRDAHYSSFK